MTAREIKGEIIDFEPYRVKRSLNNLRITMKRTFLQIVMLVTSAKIQTVTESYV